MLFDALETELKGTAQGAPLQQLYTGEWVDYVQCRHCLKESTRASEFADLTLAIRTFADPPVSHTPRHSSTSLAQERVASHRRETMP